MKTIEPRAGLAADTTDAEKEIFEVVVSEITRMQMEVIPTWEAVYDSSDVIKLLKMVKSLSYQRASQMYHPLSLYLAKRSVYKLQQGTHMPIAQLVEKFKARVEVVKEIGGAIGTDSKFVEDALTKYLKEIAVDLADFMPAHTVEAQRHYQEQYLAVILLCAVDRGHAGRQLLQ